MQKVVSIEHADLLARIVHLRRAAREAKLRWVQAQVDFDLALADAARHNLITQQERIDALARIHEG